MSIDTKDGKATQVDVSWRAKPKETAANATQVDTSWRTKPKKNDGNATQVEVNWRAKKYDIVGLAKNMEASSNYFPTLNNFKEVMGKVENLESSDGIVYKVKGTLSDAGGESAVLLCVDPDGNDVVAKVYYEPLNGSVFSADARARVHEYMRSDEGRQYTLAVLDIGVVEFGTSKYFFEIMPYCAEGDVSKDGQYSFDDLVNVIARLNEIIHSIHEANIIHRDIKPQNIYKTAHGIVLGDFGVAKLMNEDGASDSTRTICGTDGYTAPELRLGASENPTFIYTPKCDYYSFGITIASLYEGHFVFINDMEKLQQYYLNSSVPLRRIDHKEELENLLVGLCQFDPNKRFGYEDVCSWLENHEFNNGLMGGSWEKSYSMDGQVCTDAKSLFFAITKDEKTWDMAVGDLYKKYFEHFLSSFDIELARAASEADEKYRQKDPDKGLAVFLRALYAPGPLVWKGDTFKGLKEFGDSIKNAQNLTKYADIFKKGIVSHWLTHAKGIAVDEETKKLVEEIEDLSLTNSNVACYWFASSFTGKKSLTICNHTVSDIEGLIKALFANPNTFYQGDGYAKLMDRKTGAQLYGFLYSFGYKEFIDSVWSELNNCDEFHKASLLFAMLDDIVKKEGLKTTVVEEFYAKYGPLGAVLYTKGLVDDQTQLIYTALDTDGKRLLDKIRNTKLTTVGTVEEMFKANLPVADLVESLRTQLIDNPHLVLAGVYESQGIICSNIKGCFAFEIFGRMVPLGFNAVIEFAKGGK